MLCFDCVLRGFRCFCRPPSSQVIVFYVGCDAVFARLSRFTCVLDLSRSRSLNSQVVMFYVGFDGVLGTRIGKTIELDCDPSDIEAIAKSITNEVMENYRIKELRQ